MSERKNVSQYKFEILKIESVVERMHLGEYFNTHFVNGNVYAMELRVKWVGGCYTRKGAQFGV